MKPLIFLPGLGADVRLFRHQKKVFKNFLCSPWLVPKTREPLKEYARCWAGVLNLKPETVLVKVSFGGMVALEMARWVKPIRVILNGSCRSCESIPKSLKAAARITNWPQAAKILCRVFPEISGRFLGAPMEQGRVTHIHGARDPLITFRRVQPDEVVPEGGHLICLTHPREVNRFIQKSLEGKNQGKIKKAAFRRKRPLKKVCLIN